MLFTPGIHITSTYKVYILILFSASSRKFLQKTATLSMDSIIMDIEDGVATNMKEEARKNLEWAVDNLDFGKAEILVWSPLLSSSPSSLFIHCFSSLLFSSSPLFSSPLFSNCVEGLNFL